jgi:hypothetical protein
MKYRLRAALKEVTHQGSSAEQNCGSLEENKVVANKVRIVGAYARELAHPLHCHFCGRICGPFGRYEFWRGGRNFQKLRRLDGRNTRD